MKKIFMMAVMAVAALTANAQQEAGTFSIQPKAGLNVSSLSGDGTKAKAGFTAGVEGMYQAAEKFGVSLGVMYSMQGAKSKANSDIKMNYGYINIPILANYYVVKGLAIKAGIQPGFCVSKKYDGEGNITIAGQTIFSDQEKGKIEDAVNAFQFAIPVGLSYEYKNFVLDARYNIFLSKAFKDNDVNKLVGVADSRHSVFSITLGYKIPLN